MTPKSTISLNALNQLFCEVEAASNEEYVHDLYVKDLQTLQDLSEGCVKAGRPPLLTPGDAKSPEGYVWTARVHSGHKLWRATGKKVSAYLIDTPNGLEIRLSAQQLAA